MTKSPNSSLIQDTLTKNGIYVLMERITNESCKKVIEWIISNNLSESPVKELTLYVNSMGGVVYSQFALTDAMKLSSIPIKTIGLGTISSTGLSIFMAGGKGIRFLTPNTNILSHQFSASYYNAKEHEIIATNKNFKMLSDRMIAHYKDCTGLSVKDIRKYLLPPSDVYLSAKEAVKYGIADRIIDPYKLW
ncbi:MAG: ATP-dependent Clp protease proteolytic subunit [Endozoicomonadaceae bacterium]|nr:ATP-dependent Clp protease proteolytic subunit [Endozoicomonadaceae bacterium]